MISLKQFDTLEEALELKELLQEKNIAFEMVRPTPNGVIDFSFNADDTSGAVIIKVAPADSEKANQLLEQLAAQNIQHFEKDHYLYAFSDEELMEVVTKKDEWSLEDYLLSLKILEERGAGLNEEKVKQLQQQRLENLRKPQKADRYWLIFGWITVLMGGLFGAITGWLYWRYKKTLPNGERIFVYDSSSRLVGKLLFMFGSLSFILWLWFTRLSEIIDIWQSWLI